MRLPCPWDSLGKNSGVGCHFLLQCRKVKSESEVVQLCPTLSNPMDCSPQGSFVHGIFQARVLEWVAIAFSSIAMNLPLSTAFTASHRFWAEKAMEPHSSTLAGKIPWMEEPGRLQSMGSLRVGHTEQLHFHFSLSCTGEGNGNPLQCSCLENPRDGGAWWAAVSGVGRTESDMTEVT